MATFEFPESLSSFKDEIEKTDDDGTLQVYSYKHYYGAAAEVAAPISAEALKKCRGVVCHGNECVVRSIGSTPEMSVAEWNQYISENGKDKKFTFFHSFEGTLIRVFHYESKWYVSTHRKLDAYRSRWGSSRSFGELFEEALNNHFVDPSNPENKMSISDFTSLLDKNHVYMFLLGTNEHTRMVCKATDKPSVMHVGTLLNRETFVLSNDPSQQVNYLQVPRPPHIELSNTDISSYAETLNPLQYQGVIAFDQDGNHIKIISTQYRAFSLARGNDPSVLFRYLKVRGNSTYNHLLFDLYPEQRTNFITYENMIYKIAKAIHMAYVGRFVEKQNVVVSQEEYRIIRECHSFHMKDREHNKVTLAYVLSVLAMPEYVSTLNAIIKRLKNPEKYEKKEKKTETEIQTVPATEAEADE